MDHTQLAVDVMQSLALLLIGFVVLRQGRRPRQTQTSGHNSTQVQSGGTVYLGKAALISEDLGRNGHSRACLGHSNSTLCICPKES